MSRLGQANYELCNFGLTVDVQFASLSGSTPAVHAFASLSFYWEKVWRLSGIRGRSRGSAGVRRSGPDEQHAMANRCRRKSQGQDRAKELPKMISRLLYLATWVERIEPSTSRNGFKGAVMNVALLLAVVSIGPIVIPGLCSRGPEVVHRPVRQLSAVFFGHGNGSKVCACHIDFRYTGKDVEHFPFKGMPTCESEPDPQNVWVWPEEPQSMRDQEAQYGTAVHISAVLVQARDGTSHELNYGEGSYRWHCTEDPAP